MWLHEIEKLVDDVCVAESMSSQPDLSFGMVFVEGSSSKALGVAVSESHM